LQQLPPRPIMESRLLLSKLTPMKPILCIVTRADGQIGSALSDAYLGYATPLQTVMVPSGPLSVEDAAPSSRMTEPQEVSPRIVASIEPIIQEHRPGAIAFGLPLKRYGKQPHLQSAKNCEATLFCGQKLLRHDWSVPLRCTIETQLSLAEARKRKETEWEMWEEIDLSSDDCADDPSIAAAISLNAWLWEHCGGWRNTFG